MYFTKMFFAGASVLMGCWAVVQATPASLRAQDAASSAAQLASRDQDASPLERLFFTKPCASFSGRLGVCRSSFSCARRNGVASGKCGFLGLNVCCVITNVLSTYSCNAATSSGEAVFTNPNNPNPETGAPSNCDFTVTVGSDVCQLRLDLAEFSLAQPDNEGVCSTDYLTVTGGSTVPRICGDNDRQHMYVDVSPGSTVVLDVVRESTDALWNIMVTQIPCNSQDAAPAGCLQYFTSTSGTITSFNFDSSSTEGTRQLADQSYSACIQPQSGYCSVTYTKAPGSDFSLTGDPRSLAPSLPRVPVIGDNCQTDYIIILGATIMDTTNIAPPAPATTDRFCGFDFPGATSSSSPFRLSFISDGGEATTGGDNNNQGFQLTYTLNPC